MSVKNTVGIIAFFLLFQSFSAFAARQDSVYLFAYSKLNNPRSGLRFAWSRDRENWTEVGRNYAYLYCSYGNWATEKRIYSPSMLLAPDGLWHCIWQVNTTDKVFAHAATSDLLDWGRQAYPSLNAGTACIAPTLTYDPGARQYHIRYKDGQNHFFEIKTTDFKHYSAATTITETRYHDPRIWASINSEKQYGQVYKVSWSVVEKLIKAYEAEQFQAIQNQERLTKDSTTYKGLQPFSATFTFQPQKSKAISNMLLGIFFEDLNYAADGGLYAELIQNRDFEYRPSDKLNRDKTWNALHSWHLSDRDASIAIDSLNPIHPHNAHYAILHTRKTGTSLINDGYDGINLKAGEVYKFSLFTKLIAGSGVFTVNLVDEQQKVLAQAQFKATGSKWEKLNCLLKVTEGSKHASLQIKPATAGTLAFDMVSLFPQNTFKGRSNGLRADLAQTIADIHPRFMRFPGGCLAHGNGLANIYHWKNSIGPLESRVPQRNLWNYHQSVGLGYYEYFQFCEDIGAAPVPVIAAAVSCQNSIVGGAGQQGGIPMAEMGSYIQDIIDLIEYANGPVTSKWGKIRASSGHPKPFNLKYIGIGNEDLISDVFEERFTMIYKAIKKQHPEIEVIGTVGPSPSGTDYKEGWAIANKLQVPIVDEHYYESPGWFINHQNFYDNYDRKASKVYLGEYAAHLPGRLSNIEGALTEALYLTNIERNGDVVKMTSYAPLLANEKHVQWTPDLIYFNNHEVKPTVNYYIQKLYGENSGDSYVPVNLTLTDKSADVRKRLGCSVVKDSATGDVIIKLVNLLPVTITPTLDWNGLTIPDGKIQHSLLTGLPGDEKAKPVISLVTKKDVARLELPAYSFTILRYKQ